MWCMDRQVNSAWSHPWRHLLFGIASAGYGMSAGPKGQPTALWVALLLAIPVLYLLSAAPVGIIYMKTANAKPPPQWVSDFYAPARWVIHSTPLSKPLNAYEDGLRSLFGVPGPFD